MFSAVLGLFSQDLAVDLGTTTTRIYQRGSGLVCVEPTVVAVATDQSGRRQVVSVGEQARPLLGRAPRHIEAVQPVRDGAVHDFEVTEALLVHLLRRVHGRNKLMSPKMVLAVANCCSGMERRAIREACEAAGARQVHLVPRPLAAALGADLDVETASGHMVVDIGGGCTEIAVVSKAGVVSAQLEPGGGDGFDRAIADLLREHHGLLIGAPTAQALKHELGSAFGAPTTERRRVLGRCLQTGMPRGVEVGAAAVERALAGPVKAISQGIRRAIDQTSAELASDIVHRGIVLTGAGANLPGLEIALRRRTGLAVVRADAPGEAVVRGAGRLLEEYALLRMVAA